MSTQLTFRQKSVRIAACAAICGLSISFLVGEAVDQKAKLLRQWVVDPAIVPVNYLPIRPVELAVEKFDAEAVSAQLVAVNSRLPEAPLDYRTIRMEFVDVFKVARAAPVLAKPASVTAAPIPNSQLVASTTVTAPAREPEKRAFTPTVTSPAAEEADVHELESLLLTINHATAKISASALHTPAGGPDTKTTFSKLILADTAPEAPSGQPVAKTNADPEPVKESHALPPEVKITAVPKSPAKMMEPSVVKVSGASWLIKGKVTNTSRLKQSGHFEIALYEKIDSEGVPIGFPLAQEILPAGKVDFQLKVPAKIPSGYLFAEFVGGKGAKRLWIAPSVNPWMRGDLQFAELAVQEEDVIATTAASPAVTTSMQPLASSNEDSWVIHGSIDTLFVKSGNKIMQPDVVVKVRGRREATRTDKDGKFTLSLPRLSGTIYLELLKPGYHPTILPIVAGEAGSVSAQLASREAIDRLANLMGSHQSAAKGVFIGKAAAPDGRGLKGLTAQLSMRADGPFYFTEQGFPTAEKKQTTSDGRFIFFNVEPGTGYVETNLNGENIVPFQVSLVEGGELNSKILVPVNGALKGRIFNPVAAGKGMQPLAGARVRLEGSAEWVSTDSYGAFSIPAAKWIKGEKAAIEFSAEKYNNHRYAVDLEKHREPLNLFAFPASYIRRLAQSMDVDLDPYAGIVFGKVSGPALRLDALADHSPVNGAKDFYFDGAGRLRGSHNMTDPKYGTYVIFNVPRGNSLLQGNDGAGKLRFSDSVIVGPSSVTVTLD